MPGRNTTKITKIQYILKKGAKKSSKFLDFVF